MDCTAATNELAAADIVALGDGCTAALTQLSFMAKTSRLDAQEVKGIKRQSQILRIWNEDIMFLRDGRRNDVLRTHSSLLQSTLKFVAALGDLLVCK